MTSDTAVSSRLSRRMRALEQLVSPCNVLADVGCDHGFLAICFVQTKRAERAIAMDVRPGPLERAREHVERYGCGDRIALRLSDGLEALNPGEADAILIAGMGGGTILHILGDGWEKARTAKELILQPQSEIAKVREFLLQNGYQIVQEEMVLDEGKYYPMMRVVPSKESEREKWDETQLRYGKLLLEMRHPILEQYLKREEQLKAEILEKLDHQRGEHITKRQAELKEELVCIRKGLKYYAV